MNPIQYKKALEVPTHSVDVILDTDAYNEIDDQFAIAYLLKSQERLNVKAIIAAPFSNPKAKTPAEGMEKSYREILKVVELSGRTEILPVVYRGSESYLANEMTPVESEGARKIVEISKEYTSDNPLYIVAIGAITNVASALLMDSTLAERSVVVWLGGAAYHCGTATEFNLKQDIAADRVVFGSGVPIVQLPCRGVVDIFRTTEPELMMWLADKNPLADYLARNAISEANTYAAGKPWSRVIWDVTAVAWLMNDNQRFMNYRQVTSPDIGYDLRYSFPKERHIINYVTYINRDSLMEDLFLKLTK